jgi:hypothetical protein
MHKPIHIKSTFIRSSFCSGGECVEVAPLTNYAVTVRSTKETSREPLVFTKDEWDAFVKGVKAGEFDFKA